MDAQRMRSLQPAIAAFTADFRDGFKRVATYEQCQRCLPGLRTDLPRKSIEPTPQVRAGGRREIRGRCARSRNFSSFSSGMILASTPVCRSARGEHASKRVDNLVRKIPSFARRKWKTVKIKQTTRGVLTWRIKASRVHLVVHDEHRAAAPTDRQYRLIAAWPPHTDEMKYFISNAPANACLKTMLQAAFARWHLEKWFERAKQEAGFGAFEVRTYQNLIRHWLCRRLAMLFLTEQTQRLACGGGREKHADPVRAGERGGQRAGVEGMATVLARVV